MFNFGIGEESKFRSTKSLLAPKCGMPNKITIYGA